jgi:hypothetical protein
MLVGRYLQIVVEQPLILGHPGLLSRYFRLLTELSAFLAQGGHSLRRSHAALPRRHLEIPPEVRVNALRHVGQLHGSRHPTSRNCCWAVDYRSGHTKI